MKDTPTIRIGLLYTKLASMGFQFSDIIRCTEELTPTTSSANRCENEYDVEQVEHWIESNTKDTANITRK